MKERIVIKNFGPIKSIDLRLGKMTILIGEQATGKSTIAKVLAVCRYFSYIVDLGGVYNYKSNFEESGLREWGIHGFLKNNSYIEYENDDYLLKVDYSDKTLDGINLRLFSPTLTYKSERFKQLMNSFEENRKNKPNFGIFNDFPTNFLINDVKKIMDNPFFFPTERGLQSIFSLGKSSIQNIADSLFNQFALLDKISKSFDNEIEIKPLDIYYKYQNNQGYTRKKSETDFYPLRNGASGYQSVIPIVIAIKYYNEIEIRKRTFVIEEPEINLFPTVQRRLMQTFVESINIFGHSFLLPTHSPYILSSLNNLIFAYKVANTFNAKKEVNLIINEKYWINPDFVEAYYLTNGEAKSLIDKEEGIISIEELDEVSNIINEEFDKLMEIEINNSKVNDND